MEADKTPNIFNLINKNSLLDFLNIKNEPTEYELSKEFIKKTFPDLKWDITADKTIPSITHEDINLEDLITKMKVMYPDFSFQGIITVYEKFTYRGIRVSNLFQSPKVPHVETGLYFDSLATMIKLLDDIKDKSIVLLDDYKGFLSNNGIELGISCTNDKELYKSLKEGTIYKFNISGYKNINIEIKYLTKYYDLLFPTDYFFVSHNAVVKITGIDSFKTLAAKKSFIKKIELNLIYRLYEDFDETVEFYKYPNQSTYFSSNYFNPKKSKSKGKASIRIREINPVLLNYIRSATIVSYLPFKFLSYYHILEYYYDDCYEEFLLKSFKDNNKITLDRIDKLFKDYKDLRREKNMLELVLKKFISKTDFIKIFKLVSNIPQKEISKEFILPEINISDNTMFIQTLANRIYILRNAIVHSKTRDIKGKPLFNKEFSSYVVYNIRDEVKLMKWIASQIINKKK